MSKTEWLLRRDANRPWFLFRKKKVPRREVSRPGPQAGSLPHAVAARTVMKSAGLAGAIPERNEKQSGHYKEGPGASSTLFCLLSGLNRGRENPSWDL